ncbi:MAG: hypothetical protein JKY98_07845 [Gammaproteobacteria bacterium]|nr:hypothetical protein [Gammaproteobacteria bacterium]
MKFKKVWDVFSTIVCVISLSSVSEGIISWNTFFFELIEGYRAITNPVWQFLLGWIPYDFPYWSSDYLTIGTLVCLSTGYGLYKASDDKDPESPLAEPIGYRIGGMLFLPIWPVLVLSVFMFPDDDEARKARIYSLQWIGIALIVFLSLILINSAFSSGQ